MRLIIACSVALLMVGCESDNQRAARNNDTENLGQTAPDRTDASKNDTTRTSNMNTKRAPATPRATEQGTQQAGDVQPAQPGDTGQGAVSTAAQQFLREAASGGRMEVEAGQLASQRAENPQIREFGQRMVEDHGKANRDVLDLARTRNVQLEGDMLPQHRASLDRLAQLHGSEFEREYVQMMVRDHEQDVRKFEREAQEGQDPQVRELAQRILPTLREHLEHIRRIVQSGQGNQPQSGESGDQRQQGAGQSGGPG